MSDENFRTMLDEKFIDELPDNPILAAKAVSELISEVWTGLPHGEENSDLDFFVDGFAILKLLVESSGSIDVYVPELTGDPRNLVSQVHEFSQQVLSNVRGQVVEMRVGTLEQKYAAKFRNIFSYEFSDGDISRIQKLINQLRQMITDSTLFEPDHKRRLLARLERLQAEMHKRMADLDRFWGLIGDAGVAIGKFGEDAKPLVDRIKEISNIVWRAQSRAEELPSDAPMALIEHEKSEEGS